MNLRALAARGNGPLLELLPDADGARLAETIAAFANTVGGTIVVGLDAEGRVALDVAESVGPALARALERCTPATPAAQVLSWQLEETERGAVGVVTVRPVGHTLCVAGTAWVRSGAQNVPMTGADVLPGGSATVSQLPTAFEDLLVPGAGLGDLDDEIIAEYRRNRLRRGPRAEVMTEEELLREAGAIDSAGRVTAAGLMLFGRSPQRYLPQVGVLVVRFRGESVREAAVSGERYARRVEIEGPLPRQVERTWEVLYEEIGHRPRVAGLERREQLEYPPEAVREALVNALCHRDYAVFGQRVEVRLFDDRVEVLSPGGLPGHMTIDNLLDEHYSRNPRLVHGLFFWGYIEELGQGIDIIYEAMRREHHPPPEFRDTGRSFAVTLRNAVDEIERLYGDLLNARQVRVMRYLQEHERITNSQYQTLCPDVSPETLRLDLRDLTEKGLVLMVGAKRGTFYVLK